MQQPQRLTHRSKPSESPVQACPERHAGARIVQFATGTVGSCDSLPQPARRAFSPDIVLHKLLSCKQIQVLRRRLCGAPQPAAGCAETSFKVSYGGGRICTPGRKRTVSECKTPLTQAFYTTNACSSNLLRISLIRRKRHTPGRILRWRRLFGMKFAVKNGGRLERTVAAKPQPDSQVGLIGLIWDVCDV